MRLPRTALTATSLCGMQKKPMQMQMQMQAKRHLATPGRARRGLYGNKKILYGNNVSHSKRRTRRRWLPNVQTKRLRSDILEETIKLRVTTSVMRTIEKHGGLDGYLLNTKMTKLQDSLIGQQLKRRVEKKLKWQQSIADAQ